MPKNAERKSKKELNKKTSNAYKVKNKKNTRIYIVIAILILLLVQFIALGLSQAQKVLEIDVEVYDSLNTIPKQDIILNALDTGESVYSIILPDKVNNFYVTEYVIKTNEKESETRIPGDLIYLTEEEVNLRKTSLTVVYNSKEIGSGDKKQTIYYQDIYPSNFIENKVSNYLSNIVVTGFMPLDLSLNIFEDQNAEVIDLLIEELTDEKRIEKNIKFDFTLNDKTYNISSLKEEFIVSLSPIDETKVYSAYSINKKSEYIGKENVTDALGNPINTYSITEMKSVSVSKGNLNINISNIEYLGILSRQNDFVLMQKVSPVGTKGMEAPASYNMITGTSTWDGSVSTSFSGSGTAADPYLIKSGADLAYLRQRVNAGTTFENNYFQLVNNVDLDGREWDPIGSYTLSFRGNFDGSGKKIQNGVVVTATSASVTTVSSFGLFGSIRRWKFKTNN